ncbi:manganese transporter [Suicoccus acidiformans]|uniref:Manganese transporter n=1 Tax=Suicoccus acidiformans TaxID=2036206 RepID=A0A347WJ76_9LACT|nr:zinc ABC transporter substrate-binding protein [Suicoccus acidiformans]AXY25133.1 manganese transporter [Suicoccus acidiformans]
MKKFFVKLFLVLATVVNVFGGLTVQAQEDGKLNVVITTTHLADMAQDIGGEHVNVTGLMGPGVDPHGYEPTPSDIDALNNADLIGYNGLHLEAMFTDVFESMEKSGANIFSLDEAITEDQILDYKYEGKDLEDDPHIWFDIQIWDQAAKLVADEFAALDPDNADYYQANYEDYSKRLEELDQYVKDKVAELPEEDRILITAHDAFSYFGEKYDFRVEGIQGINTQTEAGTGDISITADLVIEEEVPAVFIESSVSDRNVQALIEAVEARGGSLGIGGELFSDAMGTDEENAGNYFDCYKTNVDTIVEGLKK